MALSDRLKLLRDYALSGRVEDNLFVAMNETVGLMKNRIFNSEVGTKDVNNNKIPVPYSNPYKKHRAKKGRQTAVVDFEFTGKLRNATKVIKTDKGSAIQIPTNPESEISSYIEDYRKSDVFNLSDSEKTHLKETAGKLMIEDLKEIFSAKN